MPAETTAKTTSTGPWDAALEQLREWDSAWAETCARMTTNPWTTGVLSRRFIELVSLGLNAACTNLNPGGTRRHIRGALAAGATVTVVLHSESTVTLPATGWRSASRLTYTVTPRP